tara:strand:- start:791 stop:1156 length:366 start_codon:yes stop_codon:yes gene_type:complete
MPERTEAVKPSFAGIREILHHCGPLTMRDVAEFFPGVDYHRVSTTLSAMRNTVVNRQVYIKSWTMEGSGRRYPRPVYALGNQPDARKPKPPCNAKRQREWRQRRKSPKAVNSVFAWAAAQA